MGKAGQLFFICTNEEEMCSNRRISEPDRRKNFPCLLQMIPHNKRFQVSYPKSRNLLEKLKNFIGSVHD